MRFWVIAVVGACLVAYLYYRPVRSYMSAARQLASRQAEVRDLKREKAQLEALLVHSGTGQALIQEARRLGYVRPGEHLFVIRGVKQWLEAHAKTSAAH